MFPKGKMQLLFWQHMAALVLEKEEWELPPMLSNEIASTYRIIKSVCMAVQEIADGCEP
jgi:hypothetical protein